MKDTSTECNDKCMWSRVCEASEMGLDYVERWCVLGKLTTRCEQSPLKILIYIQNINKTMNFA